MGRCAGIAQLASPGWWSAAGRRHQNQTPEEIEQMVLELRQAHMRWGPRKLKRVLERDEPGRIWPAVSTIGALLKREGLVVARKKRCRTLDICTWSARGCWIFCFGAETLSGLSVLRKPLLLLRRLRVEGDTRSLLSGTRYLAPESAKLA